MFFDFEQWIATQVLTADARDLFREAALCYRGGAYRAALLMSYLGLQSTVRDRLLAASMPPAGVPAGKWAKLHKELRDDSTWDAATFDALQAKAPAPIFPISDDLRDQIAYWKNRRNDCAHFKSNAIAAAHVDSFWLFTKSNLAKLAVNGSDAALLDKIERHYDATYTPVGADARPLAAEISSCVDTKALALFFAAVAARLSNTLLGTQYPRPELFEFLNVVLGDPNPLVAGACVDFLASNEPLVATFLRRFPQRLQFFAADAPLVRRLWKTHAFGGGQADFPLYGALLSAGLIPAAEVAAAHTLVVSKLRGGIPLPADAQILQQHGFFAALEQKAFVNQAIDQFEWGNPNASLMQWYLEVFPISDAAVKAICHAFNSEPCAHGPRDELTALFAAKQAKRDEFRNAADRLGLTLPALITSLA